MANPLELLAPAGAWDSMLAAVQNGADAVYLGGRIGNARQFAGNFRDDDEMRRAIDYCHLRDTRVYVAVNTLLLDRELKNALHYAAFLYNIGADALIVQDLGLLGLLRKHIPAMALHASTQMCLHDENGITMCKALGLRRVVLSRELSLARITQLHAFAAYAVELECFAHGAMCTAVSGVCLFSSLAGGRSGNRGVCAQPCRKAYAVDATMGYPLSLQDLNMLRHVNELQQAGVAGIKLEGRMKRPEYVGAMTRAYRMAIDGAPAAEQEKTWESMFRIFHRGSCTGYYYSKEIPAQVQPKARGGLPDTDAQLQWERQRYGSDCVLREVTASLTLHIGKPAVLQFVCGGRMVSVQGAQVSVAKKMPDTARYVAQIAKLGGTPFQLAHCRVDMPAPAYMAVSALNNLRNAAAQALCTALTNLQREKVSLQDDACHAIARIEQKATSILAIVPDPARAIAAYESGAHAVALEPHRIQQAEDMLRALQPYRHAGKRLLLQLPAVDLSGRLRRQWEALFQIGLLDGGVAQNAAQVYSIRGERIAGYLCNAANSNSIQQMRKLGFDTVLLSLELNRGQIRDLCGLQGAGIYVYGRAQLMQLWHCPKRKDSAPCARCGQEPAALQDEAGRIFPLDTTGDGESGNCLTRVRNCDILDILDVVGENPRPSLLALEFFDEPEEAVSQRVQAACYVLDEYKDMNHKKRAAPARMGMTRGHWARGWETYE